MMWVLDNLLGVAGLLLTVREEEGSVVVGDTLVLLFNVLLDLLNLLLSGDDGFSPNIDFWREGKCGDAGMKRSSSIGASMPREGNVPHRCI